MSEMLVRLVRGGVEFVVVGGYAVVAHGGSLVTQDVDICCRFNRDNLSRLQAVLAPLHPRHRMSPQKPPLELTEAVCDRLKNLYLETDLCVLDCLSSVAGVGDFDAVVAHSVIVDLPGGSFRVLGLDGLIQAKAAMDRPQDRLALTQLRAIREARSRRSGPD